MSQESQLFIITFYTEDEPGKPVIYNHIVTEEEPGKQWTLIPP